MVTGSVVAMRKKETASRVKVVADGRNPALLLVVLPWLEHTSGMPSWRRPAEQLMLSDERSRVILQDIQHTTQRHCMVFVQPTRLSCRVQSRRRRAVCIEFATSSRHWKLNMLSRVELCRAVCTHPSAVATQFPIMQPTRLDKFSTCSVSNNPR